MSGNDNSFSSDVSLPNFRILNSSPQAVSRSNGARIKSHNLKQVTMADFSNSEDSSIIIVDEECRKQPEDNPSKRVHFSDEGNGNLENQLNNNQ